MTRLFRIARRTITIAMLFGLAQSVEAADGPKPGQWTVVTRVTRDGVSKPPDSHTSCVTADEMKDPGKSLMPRPSSPGEKCTRTHYEWNGRKLNWQLKCTGQMSMKGGGDITFDTPEHYNGKISAAGSVGGRDFNSTILLEGKRVGDCPKN